MRRSSSDVSKFNGGKPRMETPCTMLACAGPSSRTVAPGGTNTELGSTTILDWMVHPCRQRTTANAASARVEKVLIVAPIRSDGSVVAGRVEDPDLGGFAGHGVVADGDRQDQHRLRVGAHVEDDVRALHLGERVAVNLENLVRLEGGGDS